MKSNPYASLTSSGTGSFAKFASAIVAANFILGVIFFAIQSRAPLKIYGKPRTLFT